jgi:membrane-bound metal-dependent hydrolase YbcI (DUF457 family)
VIAWHIGAALFLFRWIFRDPKVDVRFLALGALLPDLIDLPLGTLLLAGTVSTGEAWAHSLLAPSIATVVVLFATRRGRRRRAWMALVVGMFFHLLIDGMWTDTEVFLWPLFGPIPSGPTPYWSDVFVRAFDDPWRWIRELVGVGYLVVVWIRSGLGATGRRRELLRTGRLESPA